MLLSNTKPKSQEAELSIVLTDNAHLQELNLNYLGVDAPRTCSPSPPLKRTRKPVRVILAISHLDPRAQSQADAAGHPLEAEVQLLVVAWRTCICWDTTMRTRGEKPACGRRKPRSWILGLGDQIREERARSWSRTTD